MTKTLALLALPTVTMVDPLLVIFENSDVSPSTVFALTVHPSIFEK